MSRRILSLEPKNLRVIHVSESRITAASWRYEERGGLNVVVEIRRDGQYVGTAQVRVSTRMMRDYLRKVDARALHGKERRER